MTSTNKSASSIVSLRPVTSANLRECLSLTVSETQADFVASSAQSLAEAYVNPNLHPLAIYDVSARGWEEPPTPMVGFTVYEIVAGVGFILRLMVDQHHQRKGYGKAAVQEVIRQLHLHPEVEQIATSHREGNVAAAALCQILGFEPWQIGFADEVEGEVFLALHG